ncbi:MAG: PhzF family phenazine biosynthesis isomerase [Gaiellaceae bacterium]
MEKRLAFKKIDAFATGRSAGNPAAAVYLESQSLSPGEMQRVARELKGFVSEVGFLTRIDGGTFGLEYYSSERKVEFCGHATIAIMYDLLRNDPEAAKKPFVEIVTDKGKLLVENRIEAQDAVFISAPKPTFSSRAIAPAELAAALGADPETLDLDGRVPVVNAGLETLIVPMTSLEAVLEAAPGFDALKQLCIEHSLDIVLVYSDQVSDRASSFRTRVFAPLFGYLEDPATGSGNAALGNHLLRTGIWDGHPISLEQNGDAANPNRIKLVAGENESGELQVRFGGGAIVRIEGEYLLA